MDDDFWRDLYHETMRAWSNHIVQIKDWADRHAQHAGQAPLSELREILEGKDEA